MQHVESVRRSSMLTLALLTWTAAACSSGNTTTEERREFTDAAGRTCLAKLEKTSPTSPPVSESVSCEGVGKECSAESDPCFELSIDSETNQIRNCPACCRGTASSFTSADCSALSCASAADCVYSRAECVEGVCQCPNGSCG